MVFWLFLTLSKLGHMLRLHLSAICCYLWIFLFTRRDSDCTSTSIIPSAPGEISAEIGWITVTQCGLLEQSRRQNVTNLAEPCVPRSPLSIPTSILKSHSVTGGSGCAGGYGWFNIQPINACCTFNILYWETGQRDATHEDRNICEPESALVCKATVRSWTVMAPSWTGANYEAKGSAKTICHARALAGSRPFLKIFAQLISKKREEN